MREAALEAATKRPRQTSRAKQACQAPSLAPPILGRADQPAKRMPMPNCLAAILESRGALRLAGEDLRTYLQGIVSNDVEKIDPTRSIWTAFLTPQGKFLHELFLAEQHGGFLLDGEAARLDDLRKRMTLYRLRSKVTIEDAREEVVVAALFGPLALESLGLPEEPGVAKPFGGGVVFVDPRLPGLGARAILPRDEAEATIAEAGFQSASQADYDRLRIWLGVPDGSRDLEVERSILLENGFEELNGVDWQKGCFLGQELTARTKYRALIKKRLLPVDMEGPVPAPGTPVTAGAKEVGMMRSACEGLGLALLRLDKALEPSVELKAGETTLRPRLPDWIELQTPETAES